MTHTHIIGPGKERPKLKIYGSVDEFLKNEELNNSKQIPYGIAYVYKNQIYLHIDNEEELLLYPQKGMKSTGAITTLCTNKGRLYHSENNCVYETLTGIEIAKRNGNIFGLCSLDDKLYDAGSHTTSTRIGLIHPIIETQNNKIIIPASKKTKKVTKDTTRYITTLCSHNGKLYFASGQGIYDTESEKPLTTRLMRVQSLCSHNGELIDAGNYSTINLTLTKKRLKKQSVNSLYSVNGILYDARNYTIQEVDTTTNKEIRNEEIHGIFETISDKQILNRDGHITTLCEINPEIVREILRMKEEGEL